MARNVIDRDKGLKKILQELNSAKTAVVEIGVHEGEVNGEGSSIAEYAAYNEYGTGNIPERSFMRSTFDEQLPKIKRDMDAQYAQIASGKSTVYRALSIVGMRHQEDIQKKIQSGVKPENAPSTIARKGSNKTLIDTGALVQSIRYVVTKS